MAIIGAGFAGSLQAINLLRHDRPEVVLIERRPHAGVGVAFGAAHPRHLLNVRAANMSAFPDDPDHFVRWLARTGAGGEASSFVPRLTYGSYLRALLVEAIRRPGRRLTLVRGEVVDVTAGSRAELVLADGRRVTADAAVLAVGNLPPHDPPGLEHLATSQRYRRDPWATDIAEGLTSTDTVLLMGSGLTMVDLALMLEAKGFGGRIVALSRRGLLPREHSGGAAWRRIDERPATVASQLVRRVRARGAEIGWRNAVDELRPFTQTMWSAASAAERARFLRHLRPWWDVHRHRLAPPVADRLAAMTAAGTLRVQAGAVLRATERDDGIDVFWRPRGTDRERCLSAHRIINCTGPQADLNRTREPLLQALLERGVIRPDAATLGIDVDADAAAIRADGRPNARLHAVGPMTRGAFWEIVAVPDIRSQTWTLARRLAGNEPAGGEAS